MRLTILAAWTTLAACTASLQITGGPQAAKVEVVAQFGTGEFLEAVILDGNDGLLVGSLQTGAIYRVDPASGARETFATLPVGEAGSLVEGLFGIVRDSAGGLYAAAFSPDPERHGIWHIDAAGRSERIVPLPATVIPNGMDAGPDGLLYVADSGAGGIWRIDPARRAAQL